MSDENLYDDVYKEKKGLIRDRKGLSFCAE